jgi:5-methylcytosine-specific restriction endonuclease McrA
MGPKIGKEISPFFGEVMHVLVLDKNRQPLAPCHCSRARQLLKNGNAAVLRRYPFTIILKEEKELIQKTFDIRIDPGAKETGFSLVNNKNEVVWAANLIHQGSLIRDNLISRRAIRRGRRSRHTRYREPRFDNRHRAIGWLPPSLEHRVLTTMTWVRKLMRYAPVSSISLERVKFDMQKMANPEITGIEYQQGTLAGYEVREYLLEKWNRQCIYCGKKDVPLQIEHIRAKSRGGSNRVSNLTLSCEYCNKKKGINSIEQFLKNEPDLLKRILSQAQKPLDSAAAVNATRNKILSSLKDTGLPVHTGTGAQTKFNRTKLGYPQDHWIDAACVGEKGSAVILDPKMKILQIKCVGHGNRQMCGTDKFGFPTRHRTHQKTHFGFQTGDLVIANVLKGKKIGTYAGRVAIRASGSFNISTLSGKVQGIGYKYCRVIQKMDGYNYANK